MPFKPGQSGNPGGRRKADPNLQAAAREHTQAALEVVVACLRDRAPTVRIKAAEIIFDRGYGRPPQTIEGEMTLRGWAEIVRSLKADAGTADDS